MRAKKNSLLTQAGEKSHLIPPGQELPFLGSRRGYNGRGLLLIVVSTVISRVYNSRRSNSSALTATSVGFSAGRECSGAKSRSFRPQRRRHRRSRHLYREVFGSSIEQWASPVEHWLIRTSDPATSWIDRGLAKREKPSDSVTNIVDVPSADEFATRIVAKGGNLVQPKRTVLGVG